MGISGIRVCVARLLLGLFGALVPAAGFAETSFTCALNEGCGTADCGVDAEVAATLSAVDDGWEMTSNGEIAGRFHEIGESSGARHFVSTDIDPDAGAAALLSIFENGEAMLSLHGTFVSPMGQTYGGVCSAETG